MNEHIAGYYDCSDYPREPITFSGIPIPLKPETILNAFTLASALAFDDNVEWPRAKRQYFAFRNRILRMDAEKNIAIAAYKAVIEKHKEFDAEKDVRIAELDKIATNQATNINYLDGLLQEKDARIAELEKVLDVEYVPKLKQRIAELEATTDEAKILLEQKDRRIVGLENRIAELEATVDRQGKLLEELFYGLEWTLDEQNVELMRKVEKELADV